MVHDLRLERRTLHGHFSRDLEPVLTIDSGDSVRFATPNAGWDLEDGTPFEPRSSPEDDGHALAGPIEVRGTAGTSTARSSSHARRSICRFPSTELTSLQATAMLRKVTAR